MEFSLHSISGSRRRLDSLFGRQQSLAVEQDERAVEVVVEATDNSTQPDHSSAFQFNVRTDERAVEVVVEAIDSSTQLDHSSVFQFNVRTDELDLTILPFHDQTKFALKIPRAAKYVAKERVHQLVSEKTSSNPAHWFADLSQLFVYAEGAGQHHRQRLEDQHRNEYLAAYLLDVMGEKKLLHSSMRFPKMPLLHEILSPSQQYSDLARCTLFVAAVYRMGLGKVLEAVRRGDSILHYAAQLGYRTIIRLLCKWGVDVNMQSIFTGATPLLTAVSPSHVHKDKEIIRKTVAVLLHCGADESINVENYDGNSPLFMAVQTRLAEVVYQLLRAGANFEKTDKDGNTILHTAAQVNAHEICRNLVKKFSEENVTITNDDGQTFIHLAAMHGPRCLRDIASALKCCHGNYCFPKSVKWFSARDSNGCTPLDVAANAGQKETFAFMWEEMERYPPAHIEAECRKLQFLIDEAENDPSQWQRVTDFLEVFPKRMLHKLVLDDGAEGKKPTFHRLIAGSGKNAAEGHEQGHLGAVRAVLDNSLFGENVIVTRTLDGGSHTARSKPGTYCAGFGTRHISQASHLEALCTTDLQVWDHQTMTLWLNHKLKTNGWSLLLYFAMYLTFLVSTCVALELAADLNITSHQHVGYNYDRSNQRLALEITIISLWVILLSADFADVLRFGLYYWKWFGVYPRIAVNVCFLGLLVARISGHSSQWIFASLFIICATFRVMEILTLSKWSSIYLVTLWIIFRRELLKFLLIALLMILAFSMALRLAVQAERDEASRLFSTPANQSQGCASSRNLTDNDANSSIVCVSRPPLTLAGHLLGELESLQNLFHANFRSLVGGPGGDGYSDGLEGYKLFTATVYLVFLGLVVLLLVSVFIAQAEGSYNSVQGLADQMANYSTARLLTQTASVLPMWLLSFIMKTCCSEVSEYVWSDWPLHDYAKGSVDHEARCYECGHRFMSSFLWIWRVLQSTLVTDASSLIKQNKDNNRNHDFDNLKKELREMKMQFHTELPSIIRKKKENEGTCQCEALKTEIEALKKDMKAQFASLKAALQLHESNATTTWL